MLHIEFEYHTLRTIVELDMNLQSKQRERLRQLNLLYEYMMQSLFNNEVVKPKIKYRHGKKIEYIKFKKGDWALLYDLRFTDFKGKLMTSWLGPYIIEDFYDNGSI
jgi:hypothetical protein